MTDAESQEEKLRREVVERACDLLLKYWDSVHIAVRSKGDSYEFGGVTTPYTLKSFRERKGRK